MPLVTKKPFYSQAEALRRLNLTQRKTAWLCEVLPFVEQSGLRLFRVEDVEALADTNTNTNTP